MRIYCAAVQPEVLFCRRQANFGLRSYPRPVLFAAGGFACGGGFLSQAAGQPDFVSSRPGYFASGWLAGWQPIVYSKTAARLLKAAWCLLRIATPCAVLRRLTEVAVRPAAGCLHGSNLPPSHSSMSSVRALLLCSFLLLNRPIGLNIILSKSGLLWALTCTTSNLPPSPTFLNVRLPRAPTGL